MWGNGSAQASHCSAAFAEVRGTRLIKKMEGVREKISDSQTFPPKLRAANTGLSEANS